MYAPMSDSKKYMKMQQDYLKSVDNEYGTQFSTQNIRKSGETK